MSTPYTPVATRDKILDSAEKLYRKDGLRALSIRAIAEQVGVTPMAIYRHFRDKDAIIEALVTLGFQKWEKRFASAPDVRGLVDRIRAGLLSYVEFAIEERRLFELMYLVPRRTTVSPATKSAAFASMMDAAREAVASGFIIGDPAEVILLAWSTTHGLVALHFSGRFGFNDGLFRRVAARTIDSLLRLLSSPNDDDAKYADAHAV
jgi:AcrR family transcriptional regulator